MGEAAIRTLGPQTPVTDAARRAVSDRLRAVRRLVDRAGRRAARDPRYVHDLRTTIRRAETALDIFGPQFGRRRLLRMRRTLRRLRRAAAPVRECDVHAAILGELRRHAPPDTAPALDRVLRSIAEERASSARRLVRAARRGPAARLRPRLRRLLRTLSDRAEPSPLGHLARHALRVLLREARAAAEQDLGDLQNLHALRLRAKALRYAVEVLAPVIDPPVAAAAGSGLEQLQDLLGGVNDMDQVARRLNRLEHDVGDTMRSELAALASRCLSVRDTRHRDAIARIAGGGAWDALGLLEQWLRGCTPRATPLSSPPQTDGQPAPPALTEPASADAASPPDASGPRRFSAIDAGTNSIRLIVVEAHPDGVYRVLDDEKEVTRLGAGLERTGEMSCESMEQTAAAIARMRRIAEGYGAHAIRVVGTSACRDASNTAELARLIRAQAGLDLEVITSEEEGRLAHISAAHGFDLQDTVAAVVDIGGGSTEIVLSTGGAVERIDSLPLGAVRLTERFGGPVAAAGERFREMRRHVRRTLEKTVGRLPLVPQVVIGTGGTFTTFANILLHRECGPTGPSLWDRGVPGHEAKRSELRHVIDWLRTLTPHERTRVAGLPAERADIILAGLVIAERALRHLGANVVRVHDRGIRDGIVITMAEEAFAARRRAAGERLDPLVGVRRFADACRYEASHSEHVTRLALSIFDQLAATLGPGQPWASPVCRRLLEAGGVLHDIGYLVNYSKHHKHGYHLVVHSDLTGFTAREIEIIANLAYYHRQTEPGPAHPNFAGLAAPDQEILRRLAGILRIADGLDRTHTQHVRAVTLTVEDDIATFAVDAPAEPATDLWGATRKAGLFKAAFGLDPRIIWNGPPAAPDADKPAPAPAAEVPTQA